MQKGKLRIFWLMLIVGVAGVANTLALFFYTSANIGTLFPGAAGSLLIIYAVLRYIIRKGSPVISSTLLRRLIVSLAAVFLVSFVIIEAIIIVNSYSDEVVETDYLIILGAGLRGERVSLTLMERLEKGIEFLTQYPDVKVVVSGGQGRGESITEAEAMRRYLVGKGIDEERIIKEDRATSTMENMKFSKEILDKQSGKDTKDITIITSDFHMLRAKMLARRNGLNPRGITCNTPVQVRINCYIREYFAFIKSFLLDK
ncbi:MAG TPA: YdcF family protein [Clostridiaceae bacterium]|nr:YdcF family protein [Clostridiaceae bacterium]